MGRANAARVYSPHFQSEMQHRPASSARGHPLAPETGRCCISDWKWGPKKPQPGGFLADTNLRALTEDPATLTPNEARPPSRNQDSAMMLSHRPTLRRRTFEPFAVKPENRCQCRDRPASPKPTVPKGKSMTLTDKDQFNMKFLKGHQASL